MANRLIRYLPALILLIYGFAKINGSQFTILDSELDKPMGDVSGFWLTWYYFGYSPVYGTFLALVEITGALLLTFRRTTLLGACILAPVLANIVLIDLCYGLDAGATLVAILLLAAMAGLIAPHRREIMALFLQPGEAGPRSMAEASAKWGIRIAMVGLTFAFTYWVANFNNRNPTPLDGVWDVVQVAPAQLSGQMPRTIFFEYNRGSMAVFKAGDRDYKTHHFEIDRNNHRIRMWDLWLRKGNQIFDGSYTLADAELTVDGTWQGVGEAVLHMQRRRR